MLRLGGLNDLYGASILCSEHTLGLLRGFITRELDRVRLREGEAPVVLYEVIGKGRPSESIAKMLKAFDEGLKAYRARRFDDAVEFFSLALLEQQTDFPCHLYLERCRNLALIPPPIEWDGTLDIGARR